MPDESKPPEWTWPDGTAMTESEKNTVMALWAAGCEDYHPLLGYRAGVGPRCRLCNTVAEEA